MTSSYNIVASTNQCTVVAEYTPDEIKATAYESEAELEAKFIRMLQTLGYEYIEIKSEAERYFPHTLIFSKLSETGREKLPALLNEESNLTRLLPE